MINIKTVLYSAEAARLDHEDFVSGKGYNPPPQDREIIIAEWVLETLSAPIDDDVRDSCKLGIPGETPIECMGYAISVADARSLAAALLILADGIDQAS